MALCGAVTALIPIVVNDYYTLCAISGAFGLFIAANYSLTSIILVELITLERFTNAYGLLLLVQGIANLMGPPLAGERFLFFAHFVFFLFFFLRILEIAYIRHRANTKGERFFFSGWLYDITGTYDLSFYLAGLFIALSGALLLVMPLISLYRKCRGNESEEGTVDKDFNEIDNV